MNGKLESPWLGSTPVPSDWTEQKDLEWYHQQFESDPEDAYMEVVERLWRERTNLEDSLTGWLGTFLAEEEFDPDPVAECLGAAAKADLLLTIIRAQSNEAGLVGRFEKDFTRVKTAFDTCDRVAGRYLLQRKKVWLFELGTAVQELARSAWQLKDSIRGNYRYQRCPRAEGSEV